MSGYCEGRCVCSYSIIIIIICVIVVVVVKTDLSFFKRSLEALAFVSSLLVRFSRSLR